MGVLERVLEKYNITDTTAKVLTQPPNRKGETKPSFRTGNYPPGDFHQMDLLFLPTDSSQEKTKNKQTKQTGYRYLLVVTDIGSGKTDARPLKDKNGDTVFQQVDDIYKKKQYLKYPKFIHVDAGNEFNKTK